MHIQSEALLPCSGLCLTSAVSYFGQIIFQQVQKIYSKPFLAFLPFLLLYAALILFLNNDALFGDEGRYLQFAHNLLHGFYSPPPPDINLWNGPGFPVYLMPFV